MDLHPVTHHKDSYNTNKDINQKACELCLHIMVNYSLDWEKNCALQQELLQVKSQSLLC